MRVKALVTGPLDVRVVDGKGKNEGQKFTFHELPILDLDAPASVQSVLILSVHKNDVAAAEKLQGQTVLINVFSKGDKFYFGGQIVQQQHKAA